MLAHRFRIPAISTGEMFRAECKAGTELGKMACEILARGGLVDDELVNGIVANRISREDCTDGFLLDGYPRTVAQARFFASLIKQHGLPEPAVIHLDVPDEILVGRLTARRQCPKCLEIYNMLWQPPRQEGKCDQDGADLVTREDDRECVIRARLRAYEELTGPVLDWYGTAVHRVAGELAPAAVAREIEQALAGAASAVPLRG